MDDVSSEQPKPRQVEITSEGLVSKVVIDGHDVSNQLTGARLELAARVIPKLVLEVSAHESVGYSGPALVELASSPPVASDAALLSDFAGRLVEVVDEWAEDESLEAAMVSGSLDSSPFQALMAELKRRAAGTEKLADVATWFDPKAANGE